MLDQNIQLASYTAESGNDVTLTPGIVRNVISTSDTVTDKEVQLFVKMCAAYRLDPFIREAHLIKYGNQPATMVVGKEVFVKRAYRHPRFRGMEAGLTILTSDGRLVRRDGSLVLASEQLVGGWAKVHVEGYKVPVFDEVSYVEYVGRKKDGTPTRQWASMPGTMLRKTALVHALREAFPEDFGGLYDYAEMGVEEPEDGPMDIPAEVTDALGERGEAAMERMAEEPELEYEEAF